MAERSTSRTEARLLKRLEAAEREQQIQSAVDGVLQRALAMAAAEDMANAVEAARDALVDLGLTPISTYITVFDKDRDLGHWWHAWQDRPVSARRGYKISIATLRKLGSTMFAPRRGRQRVAVIRLTRRQLTAELKKARKAMPPDNPGWGVASTADRFTYPNYRHSFYFSGGIVGLDYPRELTKSEIAIGRRIADAFDVAYRRFEELQAKEQRARDAEIEAALERVRARAQGMQGSSEIGEVTKVLVQEMQNLGTPLAVGMFTLMSREDRSWVEVVAGADWSGSQRHFALEAIPEGPYLRTYLETFDAWIRGDAWYVAEIPEKEFFDFRLHGSLALGNSKSHSRKWAHARPRGVDTYHHRVFHSHGFVGFVRHGRRLSDEDLQVACSFTQIFDYAYGRFRELEAKEDQNRELMIQNALERVRARALGMQTSDELSDVTSVLLEQFRGLGHQVYGAVITDAEGWSSEAVTGLKLRKNSKTREAAKRSTRSIKHPDRERLKQQNRAKEAGEPWFVFERQGKILARLQRYYFQGSDIS
ncbi:MAG: hypothetical protein HOH95_09765, partial [Dehalococcoidia bacterium]|nr:hypothetical protein [Dehalococcoidia bacterium]